jgi:colanic acid/amylovoran biosynthesis glycosyltransferase
MRIVGGGPLKSNIKKLICDLNLNGKVQLLGPQPQAEIKNEMNNADIFILPSITPTDGNKEGIPVVLMEAQAMKLPVIATSYSGIPEVVSNGRSGFLVPEKEVSLLADKIEILLKDHELRMKMGEEGRMHIEKEFNINKINQRLEEIFSHII